MCRFRVLVGCILSCLSFSLIGCEGDEIFVSTTADNRPPTIVEQGPELPPGTFDGYGPSVWVLVGDPNGLEDISAVFLSIETIRINDLILRPADLSGGCARVDIEPNNNIDTTMLFTLPVSFDGPRNLQMTRQEGGVYAIYPFYVPDLAGEFAVFGFPDGCAAGPPSWIDWFDILPPAVPSTTSVFLTYIDLDYMGITVTVYDAAGESATTSFSDLRKTSITSEEEATPP